jgi:acyl carrier protein
MERRDRSLKAFKELTYIDSLDSYEKADALVRWFDTYLKDDSIENFDLELLDLKKLEELFFKSINFLKNHKEETRQELVKMQKMKRFLKN